MMPGMVEAHTHFSWNDQPSLDAIQRMPPEEHILWCAEVAKRYLDMGWTSCVGAAAAKPRLDVVIRNAINPSRQAVQAGVAPELRPARCRRGPWQPPRSPTQEGARRSTDTGCHLRPLPFGWPPYHSDASGASMWCGWPSGNQARRPRWLCSEGARSAAGLGLRIDPRVGVGGAALVTGEPWQGELNSGGARSLSALEVALLAEEAVKRVMVVPLRYTGLRGEPRNEGIAYIATRRKVAWTDKTVVGARRTGERVARAVRDAQRVSEVTKRWEQMWVQLAASGEAADLQLDQVARQVAADVRTVLRSGIGIVFRLDSASGALHSLGQDGEVVPGEVVSAGGQVLPPGFGCAGQAVALRKPFIAPDYGSGCIVVPPMMMEALAKLPTLTTMSFPLLMGRDVIGAVTVGRLKGMPSRDYSNQDIRVASRLARVAAPVLARGEHGAVRLPSVPQRHRGPPPGRGGARAGGGATTARRALHLEPGARRARAADLM